jgi:hypothetical protein
MTEGRNYEEEEKSGERKARHLTQDYFMRVLSAITAEKAEIVI